MARREMSEDDLSFFIDGLRSLRTEYLEELILKVFQGIAQHDSEVRYKCDPQYVQMVKESLRTALKTKRIGQELALDINVFLIANIYFNFGNPKNKEYIRWMNGLLDRTITELST